MNCFGNTSLAEDFDWDPPSGKKLWWSSLLPQLRNCERDPSSAEELWERSFLSWGTVRYLIPQLMYYERDPSFAGELWQRSFLSRGTAWEILPQPSNCVRDLPQLRCTTKEILLLLGNCEREPSSAEEPVKDPSSAEDLWERSFLSWVTTRDPFFAKELW